MINHELVDKGLCVGMDPKLFDAWQGEEALQALMICAQCPVKKLCEEFVRPKRSYFDGVCGGKVWKDGMRVDKRDNRQRKRGRLT